MPNPPALTVEALGDICLGHLAQEPEQLAQFMGVAGFSLQSLRSAVGSEQLGRGLIDYFAQNEPLLVALCQTHALRPEDFMRVWAKLNPAGG